MKRKSLFCVALLAMAVFASTGGVRANTEYDNLRNAIPTYIRSSIPETSQAMWIRPYATFEKVDMRGGLKVENVGYGVMHSAGFRWVFVKVQQKQNQMYSLKRQLLSQIDWKIYGIN